MLDDLTEIRAHIEAAHTEICEIAEQGVTRRWRMHIPAQPDRDSDLLISRALKDAEELADEVERLRDKVLIQGGIHNGGSVSCDAVNELLQQAETERDNARADHARADHAGAERRLQVAQQTIEIKDQAITDLKAERDALKAALPGDVARQIAEVEAKRAAMPEDERRRHEASDAPLLRLQLAGWYRQAKEAEATLDRVRALHPRSTHGFVRDYVPMADVRTALDHPAKTRSPAQVESQVSAPQTPNPARPAPPKGDTP
ncbi:hypothetical protein [Actinomadura alba]|uniref:Uncharacterized protein n=1 Tax=Actinomadura alba TaxID=406431 RepID=A0ABR7LIE5_9ACTN|nr:hypothetical protein [Actinomadura alba]MBC6464275.1 hypothetical protein [Actinomadura alba]